MPHVPRYILLSYTQTTSCYGFIYFLIFSQYFPSHQLCLPCVVIQFLYILLTSKILSWHEVLEVGGAENHSLVAPTGHIFLPFGDGVVWIRRVAVWLCVGIHGSAFMILAEALQSLPPVVQTVVTFSKVVLASYHGV